MPVHRYARAGHRLPSGLADRRWPERPIESAPLWASVDLRDGNQALPNPMDSRRKRAIFELLVQMGFKEIEVGYPAASETEFAFVRDLILQDRIPDDVTITVFTPARPELIDRTMDSLRGVDRAVVHLCLATACLWRDIVFGMSAAELTDFTLDGARLVAKRAEQMPDSSLRFEYSPETFNVTEPAFALDVSNRVAAVWDACPDRPVTLNLPSTVETDSPNIFADQIEWMHRNLDNRGSMILSVHPHNDRGTAVASAEQALMAGADRVEGTLFGNGERTGNVCLATLALNLLAVGIDPQLDFSDIDGIRGVVESANQMPVHARHPYAGDLVYTAFSGTHQDAIAKGFAALDSAAACAGKPASSLPWQVPYLPIDPKDVGRTYESVVRVNSQSGKGGVAHVLKRQHGLDLPRGLRIELAKVVQRVTDDDGVELSFCKLWELYQDEYLRPRNSCTIEEFHADSRDGLMRMEALIILGDGSEIVLSGCGQSAVSAAADGFVAAGYPLQLRSCTSHPVAGSAGIRTASYAEVSLGRTATWGAGIDSSAAKAGLAAVVCAVSRALNWTAEQGHMPAA